MQKASRKVGAVARSLFHKQGGLCHYCKCQMVLKRGHSTAVTVDHIKPKSKGGTRHKRNIIGACWACNNARGSTPYDVFLAHVKANGRPDNKPNDAPREKIARVEREKPIKLGDAPWKSKKLPKAAYADTVFKGDALAEALKAAGYVKREEPEVIESNDLQTTRRIGAPPRWAEDITDVGLMLMALMVIVVFTFIGVAVSDWLASALYRAGFHSSPTEWIAHVVGFSMTLGMVLTIAGRVVNGQFWWRT